jgi:hypothetical protein
VPAPADETKAVPITEQPPVGASASGAEHPASSRSTLAAPATTAIPSLVAGAASAAPASDSVGRLPNEKPESELGGPDDRLLLGEYSPALGTTATWAVAGSRGVPSGMPLPNPAGVPASGSSPGGSSSSGSGGGLGMAVLALLALLSLGGKPLLAAREGLGPAAFPRLVPELPG